MEETSAPNGVLDRNIGLCTLRSHGQVLTSAKGSTFYLCRLSFVDSRFARYPTLPIMSCRGYVGRTPDES